MDDFTDEEQEEPCTTCGYLPCNCGYQYDDWKEKGEEIWG